MESTFGSKLSRHERRSEVDLRKQQRSLPLELLPFIGDQGQQTRVKATAIAVAALAFNEPGKVKA